MPEYKGGNNWCMVFINWRTREFALIGPFGSTRAKSKTHFILKKHTHNLMYALTVWYQKLLVRILIDK